MITDTELKSILDTQYPGDWRDWTCGYCIEIDWDQYVVNLFRYHIIKVSRRNGLCVIDCTTDTIGQSIACLYIGDPDKAPDWLRPLLPTKTP